MTVPPKGRRRRRTQEAKISEASTSKARRTSKAHAAPKAHKTSDTRRDTEAQQATPKTAKRSLVLFLRHAWPALVGIPSLAKWLFAVSGIFVIGIIGYRLMKEAIVIEPISVPQELEDRGYTPAVMASLLRDALLSEEEGARKTMNYYRWLSSQRPISSKDYFQESISDKFYQVRSDDQKIEVPAAGFSIDALVELIRPFVGSQNQRLSGHVLRSQDGELILRLRVGGDLVDVKGASGRDDPESLLDQAIVPIRKKTRLKVMLLAKREKEAWLEKAKAIAPMLKDQALAKKRPAFGLEILQTICIHLVTVAGENPSEARDMMEKLLLSLPQDDKTRSWSYACRSDIEMLDGNSSGAELYARDAVRTSPKEAAPHFVLGFILAHQKDFSGAIPEFGKAIQYDTNTTNHLRLARSYFHRGKALAEVRDYKQALMDFSDAIRLEGTHCASYIERAWVYLRMDSIDEAIADSAVVDRLCRGPTKDSARSYALVRHAQAIRAKGDMDTAIGKLREAIELHDGNAHAKNHLGVSYFLNGQHSKAVTSLSRALETVSYDLPYTTIWLYLAQAKTGEADARAVAQEGLQRRAMRLEKNKWPYPIIWMFLGGLEPPGVLDLAKTEAKKCEANFHIAQWYLLQRQRDRAIEFFRKVVGSKCPRYYAEVIGTKIELERLKSAQSRKAIQSH